MHPLWTLLTHLNERNFLSVSVNTLRCILMHQQNKASECVLEIFSLYDALLTIMCAAKFPTNSSSASKNLSDIWNLFMSLWQTPEISSKLIFDLESNTLKYKVGQIRNLIDKYVQEILSKFSGNQTLWKVIKVGHTKSRLTPCYTIKSEGTLLLWTDPSTLQEK